MNTGMNLRETCGCGASVEARMSLPGAEASAFRREHQHIEPTPLRAALRAPRAGRRYVPRRLRGAP